MNTTNLVVELGPEKKFSSVRDTGIPLRYQCSTLPTELTRQLGAGYYVGSKETSQVVNNGCEYMKIIYVPCG